MVDAESVVSRYHRKLTQAVETDDTSAIREVLANQGGTIPNTPETRWLLGRAIEFESERALRVLLDAGVEPCKTDRDGLLPIGYFQGVKQIGRIYEPLVEKGFDPSALVQRNPRHPFLRVAMRNTISMREGRSVAEDIVKSAENSDVDKKSFKDFLIQSLIVSTNARQRKRLQWLARKRFCEYDFGEIVNRDDLMKLSSACYHEELVTVDAQLPAKEPYRSTLLENAVLGADPNPDMGATPQVYLNVFDGLLANDADGRRILVNDAPAIRDAVGLDRLAYLSRLVAHGHQNGIGEQVEDIAMNHALQVDAPEALRWLLENGADPYRVSKDPLAGMRQEKASPEALEVLQRHLETRTENVMTDGGEEGPQIPLGKATF